MYKDRKHAGAILAQRLMEYHIKKPYLLAVPRGGVVVAEPIAAAFQAPINVLITRKIGHPQNAEVAMGAVMPDGSAILDERMLDRLKLSDQDIIERIHTEHQEIQRRLSAYTGGLQLPEITGKSIILIDDGIATGYTIRAALHWLKSFNPAYLAIAVPVAPSAVAVTLRLEIDELICPLQPEDFRAVGLYYEHFQQTSEAEVIAILRASQKV